ncbi:MAG: 2-oxoacid:acceptor oxidoreductase family protein, partial [Pseudomonadota bacterium]
AHLEGKGAGMMEMAGLAQKGGAVLVHCRIGETPDAISAIRVAAGEADALIGGDLVVSAGAKTLGLTSRGRTGAVVNSHEIITGDFTRDTAFEIPSDRLALSLERQLQDRVQLFDASELARVALGDAIFSNMIVFGAAWQAGLIPVSEEAILRAIELNGAAIDGNKRAFALGRWAAENPDAVEKALSSTVVDLPQTLDDRIA